MDWYQTATKPELRTVLKEVVDLLRYGPCSKTQEDCPGCTAEWFMAAGLLLYGPEVKQPRPVEIVEEPPPCC